MWKQFSIIPGSVLFLGSAHAEPAFDIEVDNFIRDGSIARAVLKVTNTGSTDASRVYVSCAFLGADEKAIDVGLASINYIASGDHAYERASIVTEEEVKSLSCRVERYS